LGGKMKIDRAVRTQVADPNTEQLTVRISVVGLPVDELVHLVGDAVSQFEAEWERDEPVTTSWGASAPPPDIAVSVASPDVVVSMVKFSDVPVSFARFIAVLEQVLPEARLGLPMAGKRGARAPREPAALLELRIALRAERPGYAWEVDPEVSEIADRAAVRWLLELGPSTSTFLRTPHDRRVPVSAGEEYATLHAERDADFGVNLISVADRRLRIVAYDYVSAHLSLVSATHDPTAFDVRAELAALIDHFTQIEPIVQSAFVRYDANLKLYCGGSFGGWLRHDFIAQRGVSNIPLERLLEEDGIVDAQGIVFVPTVPPGIDPTWTQQPFGHLTQITAPNLDAWLGVDPTLATIEEGRKALAPLLTKTV
jgi:hypothetical protein